MCWYTTSLSVEGLYLKMPLFEQDFIMREVEIIARFLAKGLFGKDIDLEEAEVIRENRIV